jgi:DHA1 family bicyclomycin/chloramphenicol resistance-like MFS transporter
MVDGTTESDFPMSFREFITLMAMMVSITALSLDAVLPILSVVGHDLSIKDANQAQYIIGTLLLGLTLGQLLYGPLADSYGRKFSVYIGLLIFVGGSILSFSATSFSVMLIGRFLQGFGAAAPRISSIAIVRDRFSGREMARVMSFVMAVFIFVPVIAPALGELVMSMSHWRMIFTLFVAMAVFIAAWMTLRLPETLKKHDRHPFNLKEIVKSFKIVVTNKQTLGHTISAGLVFSCLIAYLSCARQVYQDYYHTGHLFAFYFALSALSVGVASLINSAIVRRQGMHRISRLALIALIGVSALFLVANLIASEQIPLSYFMLFAVLAFFTLGLLFGNLNAMAMEPMGHQAGIASSIIGALTSAISTVLGGLVGQAYDMTLIPLTLGFLVMGLAALTIEMRLSHLLAMKGAG